MLICILTKNVITSCSVTMMLFLHLEVKPLMTLTTVLYLSCALISGHLPMMLMELTKRRWAGGRWADGGRVGLGGWPAQEFLQRVWALRIGDLLGCLDGLCRADRAAAQQVQRTVVGDPEQPGAHRRDLLQLVEGDEGAGEGVLHHILTIDHRAHQARTIAVKVGP